MRGIFNVLLYKAMSHITPSFYLLSLCVCVSEHCVLKHFLSSTLQCVKATLCFQSSTNSDKVTHL